jgi:MFS family permease
VKSGRAIDVTTDPTLPVGAAWWLTTVLFITCFIAFTDRLILSVLVDPLRSQFKLSDSGVSLLQGSAFTLVYAFATLPLGRLVDRQRRKIILVAGGSLWCVATFACGLAPNFTALFIARLFVGIGEAALVPAGVSWLADSFPQRQRGVALGIFSLGAVIGGPLGISIGGLLLSFGDRGGFIEWPLIGALQPWRLVLLIVGAAGVLGPLLLLTTREPGRLKAGEGGASLRAVIRHFMFQRRLLIPLYLGMAFLSLGDYGLLSWAPTTLSRRFGWPSGQVGLAFGIVTAMAGVAGSLCGGWFSDIAERRGGTRGRLRVCAIAALLAALAAAMISSDRPNTVLAAIGLWVFASTVGGVGGIVALQGAIPDRFRGTGASLFTLGNALIGLGCGPTLVALATENIYRSPNAVGFAITTAIVPAALGACMLFTRSQRVLLAP